MLLIAYDRKVLMMIPKVCSGEEKCCKSSWLRPLCGIKVQVMSTRFRLGLGQCKSLGAGPMPPMGTLPDPLDQLKGH